MFFKSKTMHIFNEILSMKHLLSADWLMEHERFITKIRNLPEVTCVEYKINVLRNCYEK